VCSFEKFVHRSWLCSEIEHGWKRSGPGWGFGIEVDVVVIERGVMAFIRKL